MTALLAGGPSSVGWPAEVKSIGRPIVRRTDVHEGRVRDIAVGVDGPTTPIEIDGSWIRKVKLEICVGRQTDYLRRI